MDLVTPQNHRRVSQMATSVTSERSHSPLSRTGTPGLHTDPNIAPQHMFDGVTLNDGPFGDSSSLPPLNLGQHSPGNLEGPPTYEQLLAANTNLRTRVSELEVINMVYSDNENTLRSERDGAFRERDELKRRLEELEQQINGSPESQPPNKRARLSDEAEVV
jgi:GATA-binding protein, other eukaryote